jgi:hypothetical protein
MAIFYKPNIFITEMENQNELNKKYQYGWYGNCDSECNPLYFEELDDRNYIESVIRVAISDGKSFEKFTAYDKTELPWAQNLPEGETFDDYINPQFKYMDCGMGYLVVRNTDNFDQNPEISGFTIADHTGSSGGFIATNGCPDPTPTPTPDAPFIRVTTLEYDYNYDGQVGEAEITFTIQLSDANAWQYEISGDNNVYVVQPSSSGPVKTIKFVKAPGNYTLKVTALDADGHPATANPVSTDSRAFEVNALTPTPTPEKTPTPTPNPTPTPTLTPLNCECIPETHTSVTIQSQLQDFDKGRLAFVVGSEVGLNLDELTSASSPATTITINNPSGDQIGMIVLTGYEPASDGMTIYLKTTGDVCYEGIADGSNGGSGSWEVTMTMRDLPEGCQPTPTPESEDCCNGMSESTSVTDKIVDNISQGISGTNADVTGKLCWKTLGAPDGNINLQYNCTFEVENFDNGGLSITVQGIMDDSNNTFRFEATDGKCYQGVLTKLAQTGGLNVFARIS